MSSLLFNKMNGIMVVLQTRPERDCSDVLKPNQTDTGWMLFFFTPMVVQLEVAQIIFETFFAFPGEGMLEFFLKVWE